ncbi:hypothetical protein BCR44DRAFT_33557 [Catenaria anguillulae PL171]|uniref:Uncharacterized protein n=1 Tax=Catenaria anguillulae PL171 TaxID=765915 RepID=A0A1Y2HJH0_9FUNG|nr:hypothetical protein BCR44DRAFT_33557 [Catenaria anguillulae PL171]
MHSMYLSSSLPMPSSATSPRPIQCEAIEVGFAALSLKHPLAATSAESDATTLTDELLNLVLVHTIRSTRGKHNHARLGQLLVAAPAQQCPDLLSAVLTQAWWLDLDAASRNGAGGQATVHALDRLMTLARRGVWTLQYSRRGLAVAAKRADVPVLGWWYRQRTNPEIVAGSVFSFVDLTLDDMVQSMHEHVAEAAVYEALHWFFVQHFQVDMAMVADHESFASASRGRTVNRQQAQRLIRTAAMRGFETVLRGIALKIASPGVAAMGVDNWVRIVAGGHVKCADMVWTYAPIPESLGRRSRDTLVGLTHAAFASGSSHMICWCANQFPAFTSANNVRHFGSSVAICAYIAGVAQCLTAASVGGHLGLVQELIRDLRASGNVDYLKDHDIAADEIIKLGHLEVVEWWDMHGKEFNIDLELQQAKYTMTLVVRAGNLPMFNWWWATTASTFGDDDDAQLLTKLISEAAKNGHVEMVNHLVAIAKQQTTSKTDFLTQAIYGLVQAATESGNVAVLDWWLESENRMANQPVVVTVPPKLEWLKTASRLGHVRVLQWWLTVNSSEVSAWVPELVTAATCADQASTICFLLGERGPLDSESDLAVEAGQVWAGFLAGISETKVQTMRGEVLALLLQRWPHVLRGHSRAGQVKQRLEQLSLVGLARYWTRMFPEFE